MREKKKKNFPPGRVSTETPGRGDTRLGPQKKCRGHTIHTEHPPGAKARDSIGSLGVLPAKTCWVVISANHIGLSDTWPYIGRIRYENQYSDIDIGIGTKKTSLRIDFFPIFRLASQD